MNINEKIEEFQIASNIRDNLNSHFSSVFSEENIRVNHTDINFSSFNLQLNTEPIRFLNYVQITQEEYDNLLYRINNLEQRLLELERRTL